MKVDCPIINENDQNASLFWTKGGSQEMFFSEHTYGNYYVLTNGTLIIQGIFSYLKYGIEIVPWCEKENRF